MFEKAIPLFVTLMCSCGSSAAEVDQGTPPPACSTYDEASCAKQAGCIPIVGEAYDPSGMCLEPSSFVTCWEEDDTICGQTIAAVIEASDGRCWLQYSICKPTSWAQAGDGQGVCADVDVEAVACE